MICSAIDKFLITGFEREDEAKSLERQIRCFFLLQLIGEFYLILGLSEKLLSFFSWRVNLGTWGIWESLFFSFVCNAIYLLLKTTFLLDACLLEQKIPSLSLAQRCWSLVNYVRRIPIYSSSEYKALKSLARGKYERDWLLRVVVALRKYEASTEESQRIKTLVSLKWELQDEEISLILRAGVVFYLNNLGIFVDAFFTDLDLN